MDSQIQSAPVRIGIIGLGGISRSHIRAMRRLGDACTLVAAAEIDRPKGEAVLKELQIDAELYVDYAQMLRRSDIDLIDICLPNGLHARATIESLESGRTVLCEKPLACSLAELDAIAEAIGRTGRQAFSVLQHRYGPSSRVLKEIVARGLPGRLLSASLEMGWKRYPSYYEGWRGKWETEKGGCVLTCAIHALDCLLDFAGPPRTLTADVAHRGHEIESEDTAMVIGRFGPQDAMGCVNATTNSMEEATWLKFVFERMTVISDASAYEWSMKPWRFLHESKEDQAGLDALADRLWREQLDDRELFCRQLADVVRYVRTGGQLPHATVEEARATIEFIARMYESAAKGGSSDGPIDRRSPFYSTLHGTLRI